MRWSLKISYHMMVDEQKQLFGPEGIHEEMS